jgi:adenylate cyclase, class 2
MHIEVEQKFRVDDPAEFLRRLAALKVTLGEPQAQADLYFAHPARDFAKTDEALRIRRVGEANFLTFKGPKLDATTKSRREIEISFAAGETEAHGLGELLTALSFRPVAEVRKQRRSATVPWEGRPVEVVLDDVSGVGTFAELELSSDEHDMPAAQECIVSLAEQLGLMNSERRSYLEMLLANSRSTQPHQPDAQARVLR